MSEKDELLQFLANSIVSTEMFIAQMQSPGFRYKVNIENPACDCLGLIHPFKHKIVDDIVREASKYDCIKRVFVFGSSTTWYCHEFSDLDIAIDSTCDVPEFCNFVSIRTEGNCDMLYTRNIIDFDLLCNIKKGVVVYEKSL